MNSLKNKNLLFSLLDKYGLSSREKEEILSIINPIFVHDEFQKRCTKEFLHHDEITLGKHIIEVTILSYILAKKHKKDTLDLNRTLKIALLHDLYTEAWQNNPESKVNSIMHKHALRHPIEAVINSSIWFPEIFDKKEDIEIITDGIVHHMFPLPVDCFIESSLNPLELRNFEYIKEMDPRVLESLNRSSNKISKGTLSFTPSAYLEGRVVSKADKIVSIKNFKGKNINGLKALITGKNENLTRVRTLKK